MIGITLDKVRGSFDASLILNPTNKFVGKLLHKFGGRVRKVQMNSLKRGVIGPRGGKVSSRPGQPPRRFSENPDIKNTVFYYADVTRKECVIGMVLLRNKSKSGEPMPGVLEYGGVALIRARRTREDRKAKRAGKGMKAVTVAPRPSAVPAFQKAIKRFLPELIREGIMKAAAGGNVTIIRSGQVF